MGGNLAMVKRAQKDYQILREDWPTLRYFLRKIWNGTDKPAVGNTPSETREN
jgi:hypothetical protein